MRIAVLAGGVAGLATALNIRDRACERGATSIDCLKDQLKVATCCGRCEDCALRVLHEAHAEAFAGQVAIATA